MCFFTLSSQKKYFTIVLFSCLLLQTNLKSEIIYTNLEPDEELTVPTHSSRNFDIDFNTDMIPEFTFQINNLSENAQGIGIAGTYWGNQVMGDGDTVTVGNFYPFALDQGQEIYPDGGILWFNDWDEEWEHSIHIPIFGNGLNEEGHWAGNPQEKYIGVRFLIDGNIHYGWVAIEIPNKTTLIVKGFAYETEPNHDIKAGSTVNSVINNFNDYELVCSIFPNPVTDKITVNLPDEFSGKISIVNSLGAEVFNQQIEKHTSNSLSLPVSSFPDGIYIISAVSENKRFTQKFVKVK